jgi:hypothetical protein
LVPGSVISDDGGCNIGVGHAFGSFDLELHAAGNLEIETVEPLLAKRYIERFTYVSLRNCGRIS